MYSLVKNGNHSSHLGSEVIIVARQLRANLRPPRTMLSGLDLVLFVVSLSFLVLSYLVLSQLDLSSLVSSSLVVLCYVLACLFFVLSFPVVYRLVLSLTLVLPHLVLS